MIPIEPQPEPADFQDKVRNPGESFLNDHKSIEEGETVNWKNREYWRRILLDLYDSYDSICAYSAHWIPRDTGVSTVDHFVPKSVAPQLAYEWFNYRLASLKMNSRKGKYQDVLDPFKIQEGWFILKFPSVLVKPNFDLSEVRKDRVWATIKRLQLNREDSVDSRLSWLRCYCNGDISFEHLQRRAPFIAYEIRRQNLRREIKSMFNMWGE